MHIASAMDPVYRTGAGCNAKEQHDPNLVGYGEVMSPKTRRDASAELEHLKRYLVERARGRCRPPPGEQDRSLPEFRVPPAERVQQMDFARSVGVHPSTMSAILRGVNAIGDAWTGVVNALGMTAEEAWEAARAWEDPSTPSDDDGLSPNLRLAIDAFQKTEGPVGLKIRRAMRRILDNDGDRTVDQWIMAIRFARLADQPATGGKHADDEEPEPSTRTMDAGRPIPASPQAVSLRRRPTKRS